MIGTSSAPDTAAGAVVLLSANNCRNLAHFRARLLSAFQQEGFRVVALAPLDDQAGELERRGVEVRPLPMARSGTNPVADALLLARYVRELRSIRPLVYCGFTIKPNIYGSIAARLCGVPSIANVTGLGTAFLGRGALWQLTRRLYRAAFRRAHRVFFHNAEDLNTFVAERIVAPEQARVIPGSGVDLEHFRPADEVAEQPGAPVFLFIGRLLRDKGAREFIEAARVVRQRLPSARFQLLGSIDAGNRTSVSAAELQSWVEAGLVEHLGEHQDVRPFVRAATAVVLPTYREGMSRALLEAAAMGKPLVGTDVPGCRELVEEGVTGALCKARDAGSLAAAIERIATADATSLQRLGRNARAKVERDFSEEMVVGAYLEAIEELKGVRPAHPAKSHLS